MADDNLQSRRKRLLYRARHRGTRENDLLMGGFAERHLDEMDGEALDQFEALIGTPDPILMDWLSGRADVPESFRGDVFVLLKRYADGVVRH